MNVTVFRIDDRLIHGQIVTAWLAYAEAKQIICVDDKAAKDEFQKMLLEMATPKGVKLSILTIDQFKELVAKDSSDLKTLLLVRGSNEAVEIVSYMPEIKSINVGNMNMSKGKQKVLSNVWVDQHDLDGLIELHKQSIKLEVRAVPNDKSQDLIELLKKESLI